MERGVITCRVARKVRDEVGLSGSWARRVGSCMGFDLKNP
jgi:hypothetical protein